MKDEQFGNVDDIVFEIEQNTLLCIQSKNSFTSSPITFETLTSNANGKEIPLIRRFYESYKGIRHRFPNKNIQIIYITHKEPSTSKIKPEFKDKLGKSNIEWDSFAYFNRECWKPFKSGSKTLEQLEKKVIFKNQFDFLMKTIGITKDEFHEFLLHFQIHFNYPSFSHLTQDDKDKFIKFKDWFQNKKKTPQIHGFFKTSEIFKEIGLELTEYRHDFPIKPNYIPILSTFEKIKNYIHSLNHGYILLQGNPSVGKSTFLSSEITNSNFPNFYIFRYLLFRDPSEGISSRGEADQFYNDINKQFSVSFRLEVNYHNSLKLRYLENLHQISQKIQDEGKKALIIIDGLDHVSREQLNQIISPIYYIFEEPRLIPNNLIFIIGSQHFHELPWFEDIIQKPFIGKVEMEGFSNREIILFLENKYGKLSDETLKKELIDNLSNVTKGNPAYLQLIVENYREIQILNDQLQKKQSPFLEYESNWNQLYQKYWNHFGFQLSYRYFQIAGLISRINGPISITWLEKWKEFEDIFIFLNNFQMFFEKWGDFYLFRINSFKIFLQELSIKKFDLNYYEKDIGYWKVLADRSIVDTDSKLNSWNYVFYLEKANSTSELKLDPDFFVEQLYNGRPISQILQDLRLIFKKDHQDKNIRRIFKNILIQAEFDIRKEFLSLDCDKKPFFLWNPQIQNINYWIYLLLFEKSNSEKNEDIIDLLYQFLINGLFENAEILNIARKIFPDHIEDAIKSTRNMETDVEKLKMYIELALKLSFSPSFILDSILSLEKEFGYIFSNNSPPYLEMLVFVAMNIMKAKQFEIYVIVKKRIEDLIKKYQIIKRSCNFCPKIPFKVNNFKKNKIFEEFLNPFEKMIDLKYLKSYYCNEDIDSLLSKEEFEYFEKSPYYIHFLEHSSKKIDKSKIPKFINKFGNRVTGNFKDFISTIEISVKYSLSLAEITENLKNSYIIGDKSHNKIWIELIYNIIKNHQNFNIELNYDALCNDINNIFNIFQKPEYKTGALRFGVQLIRKDLILFIIRLCKEKELQLWIQQIIFEYSKKNLIPFNYLSIQLEILSEITKNNYNIYFQFFSWTFSEIIEKYSKVLLTDGWDATNLIIQAITVLYKLKKSNMDIFNRYYLKFMIILKIGQFRPYVRKDWQFHFIPELIQYIIKNIGVKEKILDDIIEMVKIFQYIDKITEDSEIEYDIRSIYSLLNNAEYSKFALKIKRLFPDILFPHSEMKNEIKLFTFSSDDIESIFKVVIYPMRFLDKINNLAIKITYDYDPYLSFQNLLETIKRKLESKDNANIWIEILKKFISKPLNIPQEDLYHYSLVSSLYNFFKLHINEYNLDPINYKRYLIELEKIKLKSPEKSFPMETSLEPLFQISPDDAFEWGWNFLEHRIIIKKENAWFLLISDILLGSIFSRCITNEEYYVIWEIYLDYFKRMVRIKDISSFLLNLQD